jgi:hypothetical protein
MSSNARKKLMSYGLKKSIARLDNPFAGFSLSNELIMFTVFTEAIRRIATLHERSMSLEKASGLHITAQSGGGKTTALEYYAKHFPSYDNGNKIIIPVPYASTPSTPTVSDLESEILLGLGDPAWNQDKTYERGKRVLKLLQEAESEMLLLDEFQHFSDSPRVSETGKVANYLKDLGSKWKKPIVIAGLPGSVIIPRMNIQLKRRFSAPFYMAPLKGLMLRKLLKAAQGKLPLKCDDLLYGKDLFPRFEIATAGLIDYVVKIIDRAVWNAGESGAEVLKRESFAEAFELEVWSTCPAVLNPFHGGLPTRPLTEPGEPFEKWDDPAQYEGKRAEIFLKGRKGGGARTS